VALWFTTAQGLFITAQLKLNFLGYVSFSYVLQCISNSFLKRLDKRFHHHASNEQTVGVCGILSLLCPAKRVKSNSHAKKKDRFSGEICELNT